MADSLRAAGMAAFFGDILCNTPKEKVAWKKRMLSTQHGISFPEDFDSLPVDEQLRRLDEAIKSVLE